MKIFNLRAEQSGAITRFLATATWEESSRQPVDLFFEIPTEFGKDLSANPNAFLVGALVSAMEAGERRIAIEGEVCPRLGWGLLAFVDLLRHWYGREKAIAIEATAWCSEATRATPRAGVFLSGGIDSLATLRRNCLLFPRTHPDSPRDAVLIYGINFDSDDSPATFARAVEELRVVTEDAGVSLIPVYTNLRRDLNRDGKFYMEKNNGALLAAVAHALHGRLTAMTVASTHDIPHLKPWGTHPLLEPHCSSFDLCIHFDGIDLSRLAKTKLVAEWETALQNIKVCPSQWPGQNCSRCEKCLRTMLALLIMGALERTSAFSGKDVSEEQVRSIKVGREYHFSYAELLGPLRAIGRHDLVRGLEAFMARERGEVGWLGPIKRIDRTCFNNSLRLLKRNLVNGAFSQTRYGN